MSQKQIIEVLNTTDLGKKSMQSGMINMMSQVISIILQLTSTIVLARIINPTSYGIIGMVMAVISFAGLFRDLGLSTATIQRKDLTHDQVSVLFWVNLSLGFGLFVSVALCSPFVVWFYNKPELLWITVVLGVNIFLSSIGAQHAALLNRSMRFKQINIAKIGGALSNFVVALIGALFGLEYWALALGAVANSVVNTSLVWYYSGWTPGRPYKKTGVRDMVKYGLNLTGFEFLNYLSRNLDNILIGKVIGAEALGFYTRAYNLIMFPISNIRTPLASVALPSLSSLQDDLLRFKLYYKQLLEALAIITMPIAGFIFIASKSMVLVLLGEKWLPVAPIMRWLSVAAFLQPVSGLFGLVLLAQGLAKRHLYSGLISAIVLSFVFISSVNFGVETLAMIYAATGYVLFVPIFLFVSRNTGINLKDFFLSVWRAALSTLCAVLLLYFINFSRLIEFQILKLLIDFIQFGLFYFTLLILLPGGRLHLLGLRDRFKQAIIKN